MCIVNETRCHGNITLVLKHNFPHEIAREKKNVFSFYFDCYIIRWKHIKQIYSNTTIRKEIKITKVAANYIMQYLLNWSWIKDRKITFPWRADHSLYKKDYLLQSYLTMSRFHIKYPMHLIVKLSGNSFYHPKSLFKQKNILKNLFSIVFVNLVH